MKLSLFWSTRDNERNNQQLLINTSAVTHRLKQSAAYLKSWSCTRLVTKANNKIQKSQGTLRANDSVQFLFILCKKKKKKPQILCTKNREIKIHNCLRQPIYSEISYWTSSVFLLRIVIPRLIHLSCKWRIEIAIKKNINNLKYITYRDK